MAIYKMNRFGHLHVWYSGAVEELSDSRDNPLLSGRESDEYRQDSQDVGAALARLTAEDHRDILSGWAVSA